MKIKYLKNLKSKAALITVSDPTEIAVKAIPPFKSKALYREWCAKSDTEHAFLTGFEGINPNARIEGENKICKITSIPADFDAPPDWPNVKDIIRAKCPKALPAWYCRTYSGYIRLFFELEETLSIHHTLVAGFFKYLKQALQYQKIFAGYDRKSESPSQLMEIGTDWVNMGGKIPSCVAQTALFKAAQEKPPESKDTSIPIEIVSEEVEKKFPNRWIGEFEVGSRGPLFWIDDGIDREGCQVFEDGMVVYSDRDLAWKTWRDIFGPDFVKDFEEQKMGDLLDEYWFNGRQFFKQLDGTAKPIPRDQLVLELRQRGFKGGRPKKGENVSEVEAAIVLISNTNRIDEIAPVVFRRNERIVSYNGLRILNSATVRPIEPASEGDISKWPFLNKFFDQFFEDSTSIRSKYYFLGWLQRYYKAFYNNKEDQGQACILVGPAKRGKTLLSNKIIAALVGGFADASDYLSGGTKFNKDLGRAACWVIDDTVSAASFQDQRKATELIKRGVANPRIEFMAKYADAVNLPWAGRIIVSLNDDPNSMSVLPTMDSSNKDKLMAFRICKEPFVFPKKVELEATIAQELPHLAKWLMDWKPPEEILDDDRFGIKGFIDRSISYAAFDNSSRSQVSELIDFFSKACRQQNEKMASWRGTILELQVALHSYNGGRPLGASNKIDFIRNGLSHLEDVGRSSKTTRPIKSVGKGSGKVWVIDVTAPFDIDYEEITSENQPF
jgi:hypothetical protein|tara:strand:- start:962 stop:3139 length:2178 start_codon:yes stop_codon:yes gene_type:complete